MSLNVEVLFGDCLGSGIALFFFHCLCAGGDQASRLGLSVVGRGEGFCLAEGVGKVGVGLGRAIGVVTGAVNSQAVFQQLGSVYAEEAAIGGWLVWD